MWAFASIERVLVTVLELDRVRKAAAGFAGCLPAADTNAHPGREAPIVTVARERMVAATVEAVRDAVEIPLAIPPGQLGYLPLVLLHPRGGTLPEHAHGHYFCGVLISGAMSCDSFP